MVEKGCRSRLTWRLFSLEHPDVARFVCGPWRRVKRVSVPLLVYRALMLLIMWSTMLWGVVVHWRRGKWFIFVTNWAYSMIVVEITLGMLMMVMAYREDRIRQTDLPSSGMPVLYKIYWISYNIAIVLAFTVSINYWFFLPERKVIEEWQSSNYVTHSWNIICSCLEFIIVGPPTRLMHVVHSIGLAIVYGLFTWLYALAGGTNQYGLPFIYVSTDWLHRPFECVIMSLLFAALVICCHLAIVPLALLRDFFALKWRNRSAEVLTEVI